MFNVDEQAIYNLFWSPEQRRKAEQKQMFKATINAWNNGGFNKVNRVGSISFLFNKFNQEWKTSNNNETQVMPASYFFQRYLEEGKKRVEKIKQQPVNSYINSNYGRTISEIYFLSKNFQIYLQKHNNLNLSEDIVFNFVIIRLFDQSYRGFIKEEKVLAILNERLNNLYNGQFHVVNADKRSDSTFGVDAFVLDNAKNLKGAIQIKPHSYYLDKNPQINAHRELNSEKNQKFYSIYKIMPLYLYYKNNIEEVDIINIEDFDCYIQNILRKEISYA